MVKLKNGAAASPPLRRFFAREPPSDAHTTEIMITRKPETRMNSIESQLYWLLRTLWDNGPISFVVSVPVLVDELERLIQTESQTRELLSSHVIAIIGDISITSQCLNQLNLYQPWAQRMDSQLLDRGEQFKKDYAARTGPWHRMLAVLRETASSSEATSLSKPFWGKVAYPIGKRRTRENVEALRQTESNLDAFWEFIDKSMLAKVGYLQETTVGNLLSQHRVLQRTQEWTEPEKPSSAAPAQDKASGADLCGLYQPISTTYSGLTAKDLHVAHPKTKIKTHGTPQSAPAPIADAQALEGPDPVDPQPTFSVDARAFKVFRTLFFKPNVTSTPGEIPWTDFVHAMVSVGFTAMKLYGSVWKFQPTGLDMNRNIQFHEPHPRGKLTFLMARHYGRRLNRAYDWAGEMFVLGKK